MITDKKALYRLAKELSKIKEAETRMILARVSDEVVRLKYDVLEDEEEQK